MMSEDSIHFPDSLKFKTHRLARTVYGGGGIMPDYFVPIDTTLYTKYHRQLRDKGALMKAHFHLLMPIVKNGWANTRLSMSSTNVLK